MNSKDKQEWIPTNPDYDPNKPMQVGGQAVIEGVMMRAPGSVATAVRRTNGQIVVQYQKYKSVTEKYKWLSAPVLRGAVGLIDMMILGIKSLNFSAEIAMLDEESGKSGDKTGKSGESAEEKNKKQSNVALIGTLVFVFLLMIGLFFIVPMYLTTEVFEIEQTAVQFNLITGAIRVIMLLLYLAGISMMKDVQQLFRYHGAEHKSVFAFELKSELIPDLVKDFSRFHPRCGTSFLLIVVLVAIISFSFSDLLVLKISGSISLLSRMLTHLPLIPVVGGLAYEVIKFSAKHSASLWGRIIIAPGLWLQRITTKEPDKSHIEVAIVALQCALGKDDPSKYKADIPVASPNLS